MLWVAGYVNYKMLDETIADIRFWIAVLKPEIYL